MQEIYWIQRLVGLFSDNPEAQRIVLVKSWEKDFEWFSTIENCEFAPYGIREALEVENEKTNSIRKLLITVKYEVRVYIASLKRDEEYFCLTNDQESVLKTKKKRLGFLRVLKEVERHLNKK